MVHGFNGRPGDERGFIHKKIFGFVSKVPGPLGVLGSVGSRFFGGGGSSRIPGGFATVDSAGGCLSGFTARGGFCIPNALVGFQEQEQGQRGGERKGGISEFLKSVIPGGESGRFEFGEAVMGRYGAALVPGVRPGETMICPPGAVLGNDALCYDRRNISNKQRLWPRGRRPLLTGGEMRCISIASAAARKLQAKEKQLQDMGMLKKPAPRRQQKQIGPGHHAHVAHD